MGMTHEQAVRKLIQENPDWPKGDLLQAISTTSPRPSREVAEIQDRYFKLRGISRGLRPGEWDTKLNRVTPFKEGSNMTPLRHKAIRLAHQNTGLRSQLLRAIVAADAWSKLPKGWTQESVEKFWGSFTGDVKHKVTKCMEQMSGKVDDTGAFCGSLADKVEGTTSWRGKEAGVRVEEGDTLMSKGTGNLWTVIRVRPSGWFDVQDKHGEVYENWTPDLLRLPNCTLTKPGRMAKKRDDKKAIRTEANEATILFANGRSQPLSPANGRDFKLRELQKVVGGLIEVVHLSGGSIMVVNEEGLMMALPPNRHASRLALRPIVGDAVIMPSSMLR